MTIIIEKADNEKSTASMLDAKLASVAVKIKKAKVALVEEDKDMRSIVQDQIRELNKESAEIVSELANRRELAKSPKLTRSKLEKAISVVGRLPEALKASEVPQARKLISTLISQIEITAEKKGNKWQICKGKAQLFNPLFQEQNLSTLS